MKRQKGHRRASRRLLMSVGIVLLCVGAASLLFAHYASPSVNKASDLAGNAIAVDGDAPPNPAAVKAMDPAPMPGVQLVIPSVGLDVPVEQLTATGGSVEPPGFTDAYQLRNFGTSLSNASSGTVYLIMHSVRGGGVGPGNYLIDVGKGTTTLSPGAAIQVGGHTYQFLKSDVITKSALPERADVWTDEPGRLVLITCLQNTKGTPSTQNIVLSAQLIS